MITIAILSIAIAVNSVGLIILAVYIRSLAEAVGKIVERNKWP